MPAETPNANQAAESESPPRARHADRRRGKTAPLQTMGSQRSAPHRQPQPGSSRFESSIVTSLRLKYRFPSLYLRLVYLFRCALPSPRQTETAAREPRHLSGCRFYRCLICYSSISPSPCPVWRVARVVEGASLENWNTGNRIGGSNPSLSATKKTSAVVNSFPRPPPLTECIFRIERRAVGCL